MKGENVGGRLKGEDILTVFADDGFWSLSIVVLANYLILTMHQNNRKIALWNVIF